MKHRSSRLASIALGMSALQGGTGAAQAGSVTLDFEGVGVPEGAFVTAAQGVEITGAFLIEPGNPRTGFNGRSGGGPGGIDDAGTGNSLGAIDPSGAPDPFATITFRFERGVSGVSLDLLDVERGSGTLDETIEVRLFADTAGTSLLASSTVVGSSLPGPTFGGGIATTVSLMSAELARLLTVTRTDAGSPNITGPGYAVDNLSFTMAAVPLPGSGLVLLTGLAAAGAFAARRRD